MKFCYVIYSPRSDKKINVFGGFVLYILTEN